MKKLFSNGELNTEMPTPCSTLIRSPFTLAKDKWSHGCISDPDPPRKTQSSRVEAWLGQISKEAWNPQRMLRQQQMPPKQKQLLVELT